ncbi:MAG: aldo/keto reductase [Thermotogota bacterium]|nr:aldo/keto reductase [Thermotogota bacterium]
MLGKSKIIYGTMGLGGAWNDVKVSDEAVVKAEKAFETAIECGITFFDFADIYSMGKSERVFGEVIKKRSDIRKTVKIQSKTGIILPDEEGINQFDFSASHLIKTVEKSLKNLGVNMLDSLLLHRPDPLMNPNELKEAFDYLFENKMIAQLGVSNMNQYQIQFIEKATGRKVRANQLEISLLQLDWLDGTIGVNNDEGFKSTMTPGLMEYMMLNDIEIQAWSPMARGLFGGKALEKHPNEIIAKTKDYVFKLAQEKETSPEAIVLAFVMKHSGGIRPVIGTTSPERIKDSIEAEKIKLSRREWYKLYILSRGEMLP